MESRGESELQQLVSSDGDCENDDSTAQDDHRAPEGKVTTPGRSNRVCYVNTTCASHGSSTTNVKVLILNELILQVETPM